MVRIILEDIKPNRERRKIPSKGREVVFSKKIITHKDNYKPLREKIIREEIKETIIENNEKDYKLDKEVKEKFIKRQRIERTPHLKNKHSVVSKFTLVLFIIVLIGGGVYWGGDYLQKANVSLTAKHQLITYKSKQFLASKDVNSNAIDFEIMIISDKKTKNIVLTEPQEVSTKATGVITLYNEFSTTPQKISAGAFISDSDGKAYKIDSTLTIPGYKLDTNKKIIPGQIDAKITAFLVGDAYNGSPEDFHITSFKKTNKYDKIYGKLKTSLSGGASGLVYVLSDKDKTNLLNIAQSSLKEDLFNKTKAQVPSGYILYPEATTFSYKIDENFFSKTPEAKVEMEGVMSVVLLEEKSLLNNIIKISLPTIKGEELKEITIPYLSKLSFSFANSEQEITKDMNSVSFFLTGDLVAIWEPDVENLKNKLVGVNKDSVLQIFRQDPGIASAIVKIFPIWQKYIPKDVTKINIIVD